MSHGPDLLRPYEGTGRRVTIRRADGPSLHGWHVCAATIRDAAIVKVGPTVGACIDEPYRDGTTRRVAWIDASTVYSVEPEENDQP